MLLGTTLQRGKTLSELAWGVTDNAFQMRLQGVVNFALEQIRKVGRDLGRKTLYTKSNPQTQIHVAQKFNVTKIALISSIDERGLPSDDE